MTARTLDCDMTGHAERRTTMNSRRFGLPSLVVAVCIEMGSAPMAQDSRIKVDPIIGF